MQTFAHESHIERCALTLTHTHHCVISGDSPLLLFLSLCLFLSLSEPSRMRSNALRRRATDRQTINRTNVMCASVRACISCVRVACFVCWFVRDAQHNLYSSRIIRSVGLLLFFAKFRAVRVLFRAWRIRCECVCVCVSGGVKPIGFYGVLWPSRTMMGSACHHQVDVVEVDGMCCWFCQQNNAGKNASQYSVSRAYCVRRQDVLVETHTHRHTGTHTHTCGMVLVFELF